MSSLRIGIVGLKCYDHLVGAEVPRYLGGIETQLAVLAKGLVRQGHEVTVVTYDHGQGRDTRHDGVRALTSYGPTEGIRLARAVHPRFTGLRKAMADADADIWLQMGGGFETGLTALCARSLGRPFVFCMASDANFGDNLTAGPLALEGRAYRFGLKRAAAVIAQTERQQRGLEHATGIRSTIIPMAIIPPAGEAVVDGKPHVLWVGRIMPSKRLDWLIHAAQRMPEVVFDVVGTPNHSCDQARAQMETARQLPNMRVHGRAPASVLASLYAGASLLACTSELEGFPTTFLEAWSIGLPVVTTFDPDDTVASHGLGEVAGDRGDFEARLSALVRDESRREAAAARVRAYFQQHHSVERVCEGFGAMLREVARGDRRQEVRQPPRQVPVPKS